MDTPQQDGSLLIRSFNAPYRPSAWIACVLIFWTGFCALRDFSGGEPWIAVGFTVTTYFPTIWSAGDSFLHDSGRDPEAPDVMATVRERARHASFIAATWIVTAIARVIFRQWPDRFHVAHVPERQVLCIVVFLAFRHAFDERARKQRGGASLHPEDDEEHDTHPVTVNAEAATAETHADAGIRMYHPSAALLILSISLCILVFITEGIIIGLFKPSLFILARILQATIPTSIFHISLGPPNSELALQAEFVDNANFSLELTAIWIATIPSMFSTTMLIPGLLEVFVLSYMSVQYTLGLWKTLSRFE